ncbi:MAG: metal-dependent transcriptional regulator [Candidatus Baldrarchaeia archaeon]
MKYYVSICSLEDSVRRLLALGGHVRFVKLVEFSKSANLPLSSAFQIFRKLHELGLARYVPRKGIMLTEHGIRLGVSLLKKLILTKTFLVCALGLDEEAAEREACTLEHYINEHVLTRIIEFLRNHHLRQIA